MAGANQSQQQCGGQDKAAQARIGGGVGGALLREGRRSIAPDISRLRFGKKNSEGCSVKKSNFFKSSCVSGFCSVFFPSSTNLQSLHGCLPSNVYTRERQSAKSLDRLIRRTSPESKPVCGRRSPPHCIRGGNTHHVRLESRPNLPPALAIAQEPLMGRIRLSPPYLLHDDFPAPIRTSHFPDISRSREGTPAGRWIRPR